MESTQKEKITATLRNVWKEKITISRGVDEIMCLLEKAPVTPSEEKCEHDMKYAKSIQDDSLWTTCKLCTKQPSTKSDTRTPVYYCKCCKMDVYMGDMHDPDHCKDTPNPPLNAQTRIEKLVPLKTPDSESIEMFLVRQVGAMGDKINELCTHIEELYKRIERMEER